MIAAAVTPRPGANSTTSEPGMTARLSAHVLRASPPGRSTVFPARASTQWPGAFSTGRSAKGRASVDNSV